MDVGIWDTIEEQLAILVLEKGRNFAFAIGEVCHTYRHESAEVLMLAGISFLTDLDRSLGFIEDGALVQSHNRYRVLAALAADVALLPPEKRTCADLSAFWIRTANTVFRHERPQTVG